MGRCLVAAEQGRFKWPVPPRIFSAGFSFACSGSGDLRRDTKMALARSARAVSGLVKNRQRRLCQEVEVRGMHTAINRDGLLVCVQT